MGCDECQAVGQTSRCAQLPQRIQRGKRIEFYDEQGEPHVHDGGFVFTPFMCDKGHRWEHKGYTNCPTCGVQVDPSNEDQFGRTAP